MDTPPRNPVRTAIIISHEAASACASCCCAYRCVLLSIPSSAVKSILRLIIDPSHPAPVRTARVRLGS